MPSTDFAACKFIGQCAWLIAYLMHVWYFARLCLAAGNIMKGQ